MSKSIKFAVEHDTAGSATQPARTRSSQAEKFEEAARALGADPSEEVFNEALRRVARAPVSRKGETAGDRVPSNRRARKTYTTKRLKKTDEA